MISRINKIMNNFLKLISRSKSSNDKIQKILMGLNSNIPELNKKNLKLKKEKNKIQNEIITIEKKQKKILEKKELLLKTNENYNLIPIEKAITSYKTTTKKLKKELQNKESELNNGLNNLKKIITKYRIELQKEISKLDESEKQYWTNILKKDIDSSELILFSDNEDKGNETIEKYHSNKLTEVWEKINEIELIAKKIKNAQIKKLLTNFFINSKKVISFLEENPSYIQEIRMFRTYYLDATINIVQDYILLKEEKSQTKKIKKTLLKIKNQLKAINSYLEKLYSKLFENKFIDIDAEIKVLESTLKE